VVDASRPGAILLVGGASARMGTAKADLEWRGGPLAAHLAGVLTEALPGAPVVVVAGVGQVLPPLPDGVEVARDSVPNEGPLRGLLDGLRALGDRCDLAVVCAVDTPLLHPAMVRALVAAIHPADEAIVPVAHGHRHPLTAVYRTSLRGAVTQILDDGERRMGLLVEKTQARLLDEVALRALPIPGDPAGRTVGEVDPDLDGLLNANTPEEFAALGR
jgi:molybdopterin-guanine dinucleotide biosynthesis protein A